MEWIEFYHEGKVLCSLYLEGLFPGEIAATKELLAREHGVSVHSIRWRKR